LSLRKPVDARCIWQEVCGIMRIELSTCLQWKQRYVQLNTSGRISKTEITLYLTGHRDNIAQTGWRALYLAANVGFNAHRIVNISQIAAEIRLFEY
jgi:hypothetical protein